MKKTPRGWNSTLKSGKPPKRRTPLRTRGRSRFRGRKNEAFRVWIRGLPCVVQTHRAIPIWFCGGPVECAHVRSKGAGGADEGNCIPCCAQHHRWSRHSMHVAGNKTFEHGLTQPLAEIAQSLAARWRAETGDE